MRVPEFHELPEESDPQLALALLEILKELSKASNQSTEAADAKRYAFVMR